MTEEDSSDEQTDSGPADTIKAFDEIGNYIVDIAALAGLVLLAHAGVNEATTQVVAPIMGTIALGKRYTDYKRNQAK